MTPTAIAPQTALAAPTLNDFDIALLQLLAASLTTAQIARITKIASPVISGQVRDLPARLGATTRAQAVALAVIHGHVEECHVYPDGRPTTVPLTQRQLDVLRGWAGGLRNQQLAEKLGVTTETIRSCSNHIMSRLAAGSQIQACGIGVLDDLVRLSDIHPHLPQLVLSNWSNPLARVRAVATGSWAESPSRASSVARMPAPWPRAQRIAPRTGRIPHSMAQVTPEAR